MKGIFSKPIPQIAWYLQIKDDMPKSFRTIDHMTTWEIGEMYRQQFYFCDTCDGELGYDEPYLKLDDHILHLINPHILFTCKDCIDDDFRCSRVIAESL